MGFMMLLVFIVGRSIKWVIQGALAVKFYQKFKFQKSPPVHIKSIPVPVEPAVPVVPDDP
jgi:hypothetical protein